MYCNHHSALVGRPLLELIFLNCSSESGHKTEWLSDATDRSGFLLHQQCGDAEGRLILG